MLAAPEREDVGGVGDDSLVPHRAHVVLGYPRHAAEAVGYPQQLQVMTVRLQQKP